MQAFSLDIKDKEFIVLVGPSGCGKSTTLRMVAGLEEISDGELIIDGKVMNGVAPKDRDIAMVFQAVLFSALLTSAICAPSSAAVSIRNSPCASSEQKRKHNHQ